MRRLRTDEQHRRFLSAAIRCGTILVIAITESTRLHHTGQQCTMTVEPNMPSALSHFDRADLLDALSTGIVVLDAQLRPIYANIAAQSLRWRARSPARNFFSRLTRHSQRTSRLMTTFDRGFRSFRALKLRLLEMPDR
jgi:hypothetical protein